MRKEIEKKLVKSKEKSGYNNIKKENEMQQNMKIEIEEIILAKLDKGYY